VIAKGDGEAAQGSCECQEADEGLTVEADTDEARVERQSVLGHRPQPPCPEDGCCLLPSLTTDCTTGQNDVPWLGQNVIDDSDVGESSVE
jgi:hypothetical protein